MGNKDLIYYKTFLNSFGKLFTLFIEYYGFHPDKLVNNCFYEIITYHLARVIEF